MQLLLPSAAQHPDICGHCTQGQLINLSLSISAPGHIVIEVCTCTCGCQYLVVSVLQYTVLGLSVLINLSTCGC